MGPRPAVCGLPPSRLLGMRACISVCLAELAKETRAPPISSEPLFSRAL